MCAWEIGDTVAIGEYTFRFEGTRNITGPNYPRCARRGRGDQKRQVVEKLHPEKRIYNAQQMPMTEAAIDTGLTGDIYVSLGIRSKATPGPCGCTPRPFVTWIWEARS